MEVEKKDEVIDEEPIVGKSAEVMQLDNVISNESNGQNIIDVEATNSDSVLPESFEVPPVVAIEQYATILKEDPIPKSLSVREMRKQKEIEEKKQAELKNQEEALNKEIELKEKLRKEAEKKTQKKEQEKRQKEDAELRLQREKEIESQREKLQALQREEDEKAISFVYRAPGKGLEDFDENTEDGCYTRSIGCQTILGSRHLLLNALGTSCSIAETDFDLQDDLNQIAPSVMTSELEEFLTIYRPSLQLVFAAYVLRGISRETPQVLAPSLLLFRHPPLDSLFPSSPRVQAGPNDPRIFPLSCYKEERKWWCSAKITARDFLLFCEEFDLVQFTNKTNLLASFRDVAAQEHSQAICFRAFCECLIRISITRSSSSSNAYSFLQSSVSARNKLSSFFIFMGLNDLVGLGAKIIGFVKALTSKEQAIQTGDVLAASNIASCSLSTSLLPPKRQSQDLYTIQAQAFVPYTSDALDREIAEILGESKPTGSRSAQKDFSATKNKSNILLKNMQTVFDHVTTGAQILTEDDFGEYEKPNETHLQSKLLSANKLGAKNYLPMQQATMSNQSAKLANGKETKAVLKEKPISADKKVTTNPQLNVATSKPVHSKEPAIATLKKPPIPKAPVPINSSDLQTKIVKSSLPKSNATISNATISKAIEKPKELKDIKTKKASVVEEKIKLKDPIPRTNANLKEKMIPINSTEPKVQEKIAPNPPVHPRAVKDVTSIRKSPLLSAGRANLNEAARGSMNYYGDEHYGSNDVLLSPHLYAQPPIGSAPYQLGQNFPPQAFSAPTNYPIQQPYQGNYNAVYAPQYPAYPLIPANALNRGYPVYSPTLPINYATGQIDYASNGAPLSDNENKTLTAVSKFTENQMRHAKK